MKNGCDLIIITGPNATGKTTASNYLRSWLSLHEIPLESEIVSDAQFLLESLRLDDNRGGFHHTHDWCEQDRRGHNHSRGEPEMPFINIDNENPNNMFRNLFKRLTFLPKADKLYLVECAGGVNTNPSEEACSQPDYSYSQVKKKLLEGIWSTEWLKRVWVVIHLQAEYSIRSILNERAYQPSLEEMEKGTSSWKRSETMLRLFGQDDFSEIEDLFRNAGITTYTLDNEGGNFFFEQLNKLACTLFTSEYKLSK